MNINSDDYYNFGFFLVKLNNRADYMNKNIIPEKLLSGSDCICERYPNIKDFYSKVIDEEHRFLINKRNDDKFDPLNFYFLEDIKEYQKTFYKESHDIKIISLNIHKEDYKNIIDHERDYFYEKTNLLNKKIPADISGKVLGFEILGFEFGGQQCHSYICNGLETDYDKEFGFKLNQYGFIDTYPEARKLSDYTNDDELAEPVVWLPVLLIQYV